MVSERGRPAGTQAGLPAGPASPLVSEKDVLERFLECYGPQVRLAMEFRHPSWFLEEVLEVLENYGAARVITETDEEPARRDSPGAFTYLRLRKSDYEEEELAAWGEWIEHQPGPAFAYFKHERQAPALAQKLLEHVRST